MRARLALSSSWIRAIRCGKDSLKRELIATYMREAACRGSVRRHSEISEISDSVSSVPSVLAAATMAAVAVSAPLTGEVGMSASA